MAGWGPVLESSQLRAVTAYVFYLARQPVPETCAIRALSRRIELSPATRFEESSRGSPGPPPQQCGDPAR